MRSTLICAFLLVAAIGDCEWSHSAQVVPGPWDGTIWIDRWNQGRIAPHGDFVDAAWTAKVRKIGLGRPIRLFSPNFDSEHEPAPTCLIYFESIKPLSQPVEIRLRWLDHATAAIASPVRRLRKDQQEAFEIQITNKGTDELTLDNNDLFLLSTVRHPPAPGYNGFQRFYSEWRPKIKHEQRGVFRYCRNSANLFPQDSELRSNPNYARVPQPRSDHPVSVKAGESFRMKVTISGWEANEYELMVEYRNSRDTDNSSGSYSISNPLALDVLTDEPRKDDVVELRVRQRDKTEIKPGQPVALEIEFKNQSKTELRFPILKGTKDDLDLSDLLFCYGADGRLLPLKKKVAGPMEIRIPVGESFTLPVDAPEGTVVARAVFMNQNFAPPLPKAEKGNTEWAIWGWHWSGHWIAPSIRQQLDAAK
jgi:hypothetical protein